MSPFMFNNTKINRTRLLTASCWGGCKGGGGEGFGDLNITIVICSWIVLESNLTDLHHGSAETGNDTVMLYPRKYFRLP